MDMYPDPEYGGVKTKVDLARLGEDMEVEVPFLHPSTDSADVLEQAAFGGGPFDILALNGGTIDISSTTDGVFTPLRLGRNTQLGDKAGFLIGVFTDDAAL
jgi:hypothetical protein